MNHEDIRKQLEELVREFYKRKEAEKQFVPGKTFIQYSGDVITYKEIVAVINSLLDGRLATGKRIEQFERAFADYLGVKDVVTVSSGSDADMIAINALTNPHLKSPMKNGDEILTCALNFATPISSILQNNLRPVLVDTKLGNYTMDTSMLEDAISEKTKAILAVHIFGNSCNMDDVMRIAEEHNLYVIEDCCDAHGTVYDGKKVGSIGNMGTFSFYPAHQMTLMEGGAITTSDDQLSYLLKSLRMWGRALPCKFCGNDMSKSCPINHNYNIAGMENYDMSYLFINIGFNSKLLELQGGFGLEQLARLDEFNKIRGDNFNYIVNALKPYEDQLVLPQADKKSKPVWYSIPLTVSPNAGFKREDILKMLTEAKIEYRNLFTGNIMKQPAFRNVNFRVHGSLNNADLTTTNSFFIGCYQGITKEMREYIVEKLTQFLDSHRK